MTTDTAAGGTARWDIVAADACDWLQSLPADSVHCCVTSPPYFGLRDYGVPGQVGLEDSPNAYVERLVEVFANVRRVLRPDGVLWLNLGDSYANRWPSRRDTGRAGLGDDERVRPKHSATSLAVSGLKPKDLLGVPWLAALALRDAGWYLRQDIVWHKPNPMPESVRDRCTKAHEYVFMLTKSPAYFYDGEAVKEPATGAAPGNKTHRGKAAYDDGDQRHRTKGGQAALGAVSSRNLRSVWPLDDPAPEADRLLAFAADYLGPDGFAAFCDAYDETLVSSGHDSVWRLSTRSFKGSHFAVMSPLLAARCVLAGTSAAGCCPACGTQAVRRIERRREPTRPGADVKYLPKSDGDKATAEAMGWNRPQVIGNRDPRRHVTRTETVGWDAACGCGVPLGDYLPAVVIDPFAGSGTAVAEAVRLGRRGLGCDLNPQYVELARGRVGAVEPGVLAT